MSLFKNLLLFCVVFTLNSCSITKNQIQESEDLNLGLQVNNQSFKTFENNKLNYYVVVTNYNDLICFEAGNDSPLCFEIEQRIPNVLDNRKTPYLYVTLYEPSIYNEEILSVSDLKSLILE